MKITFKIFFSLLIFLISQHFLYAECTIQDNTIQGYEDRTPNCLVDLVLSLPSCPIGKWHMQGLSDGCEDKPSILVTTLEDISCPSGTARLQGTNRCSLDRKTVTLNDTTMRIDDNESSGTLIGTIIISDTGDNSEIKSFELSGEGIENFVISSDGEIRLSEGVNLDYRLINVYNLTAYAINNAGRSISIKVIILINPDMIAPVITLNGVTPMSISQRSVYQDAGAIVTDNIDTNITLVVTSSVDTSKVGSYTITYSATDSSYNTTVETRVVNVTYNPIEILILYDNVGEWGYIGKSHAILLENLLGHFDSNIVSKPTISYIANDIDNYEVIFYLGTTYNPLSFYETDSLEKEAYMSFFEDVAIKDKTIVWINYNLSFFDKLWRDNQWGDTTFGEKYGMQFKDIASMLPYNRIEYKNTELFKGVIPFASPGSNTSLCLDEGNNRYACEKELVIIEVLDENRTEVFATAYSTLDSTVPVEPYMTRGGNFWFVGDTPFSYISEEDRYLAFADILHDMLGIYHPLSRKALVRLEDVDARTELNHLNSISNYLHSVDVVFSIATIPQYEDPLAIENDVSTTVKLFDSDIGYRLKDLYDEGIADIVQHGYTHQFDTLRNPYNGLSGDGFEFMRVIQNTDNSYSYLYPTGPIEDGVILPDIGPWAYDRMSLGESILGTLGIQAFAWEAPHYMAGPNHYRAIRELYPVQYARMIYFPNESSDDMTLKYKYIGQFFPYVIKKDIYGYYIIPENIHNIEDAPNAGYREITPEDIIHFAKKLKVVRDGVASFFYHPYLGTSDLSEIIVGIENLGYEFVSAPSLIVP